MLSFICINDKGSFEKCSASLNLLKTENRHKAETLTSSDFFQNDTIFSSITD